MVEFKVSSHSQYTAEQVVRHVAVIHFDNLMIRLSGSDNQGLSAGGLCKIQDLQIGDTFLPKNAKHGAESSHEVYPVV